MTEGSNCMFKRCTVSCGTALLIAFWSGLHTFCVFVV